MKRYYLTAEHRSAFLGQLRDMTQVNQSAFHHSQLQKPRIDRDDRAVAAVVELIDNWTNSFEGSQLILSSGNVAPKDVTHDLLRVRRTGEEAYDSFKRERLEEASRKKQFHDPMRKARLNTLTTIERKNHVHISGNVAILKADRSLFGRMIVIAQSWQLNMRAIFVHPLGPIPWALATPECFPRKFSKAVLAHHVQKGAALAEYIPDKFAIVIDGMRLVQNVGQNDGTFFLESYRLLFTPWCSKKEHTVRELTLCLTPSGTCQLRMLSELCGVMIETYKCRTYLRHN